MAKLHFLNFLLRDQPNDLVCEVRAKECDRLRDALISRSSSEVMPDFFAFDTVDGRTVAINLAHVQAVRYLWDPAKFPSDLKRDSGIINICLRGREKTLEEYTENPEQLTVLFSILENGSDVEAFPSFLDGDGEELQLNAKEIVWVAAPSHLLKEGHRIIEEDGDLRSDV